MLGLSLDSWNELLVGFLGVAAVAAIIIGVSTYAVVRLSKQEALDAEEALKAYKLTVDGKVADAKSAGIKAGETASNALLRAEELRAANLALEAQIAPRRLTEAQGQSIAEELAGFSGKRVAVISYTMDSEAAVLANQIIEVLRYAKMEVYDQVATVAPMGGFNLGVRVAGPDAPFLVAIRGALESKGRLAVSPPNTPLAGGAAMEVVTGEKKPVDAEILVGVKPIIR